MTCYKRMEYLLSQMIVLSVLLTWCVSTVVPLEPVYQHQGVGLEHVNQVESTILQKLEAIILELRDITPVINHANREDSNDPKFPNFSNRNWRTHFECLEYSKKGLSNERRILWPNRKHSSQEMIKYPHQRHKHGGGCQLVLQEDLDPKREPLILSFDGKEIILPDEVDDGFGLINMYDKETLLLACPRVRGTNEVDAEMKCEGGKLLVGDKKASASSTSCARSYATSAVRITREPCGTGDEVEVEIGFQVIDGGSERWVPEITVCHNVRDMYSLYAVHKVYGPVIGGKVIGNGRKGFTVGNSHLFQGINPDKVYTKKSVTQTLDEILGYGAGRSLIKGKYFIAKGHLAPVADFIYYTGQMATMSYVNTAPQWQSFNTGSWLSVENTVRDLAEMEGETLVVYTGIVGTQTLTYKSKKAEFYLAATEDGYEVIPVPEVFWKLVFNPVTKACLAVVGHNNVFAKKRPKPLCQPLTDWPTLSKLESGYTYFCEYHSFRDFVTYIPDVPCKGTLKNPKY